MNAVDLFAGPGGWDIAAREMGLDPLGIEFDPDACATREAAGLRTLQADIAALSPDDFAPCDLLIASPPCPSFSTAGKGKGMDDMPLIYESADRIAEGQSLEEAHWHDERSALVLEPLRWALALEPRFLAWEQVPPVLPFWERCAEILRGRGWNVWTGKVEAERYGVPQTRERVILMADRDAPVHPPRPTHQRYVKGEPQRHEVTLEREVLPWISMAEALGWASTDEIHGERGAGMTERYGARPGRSASEPAPAITAGSKGSGPRLLRLRNGNQDNATERDAAEPASTIAFGHNAARVEWVLEKPEDRPEAQGAGNSPRSIKEPASTITSRADLSRWQARDSGPGAEREPRGVAQPGRHDPEESGSQQKDAIRVSEAEALVLQSFPPAYPLQGTKSKRFLQIGNAVPPLLAYAILRELLP